MELYFYRLIRIGFPKIRAFQVCMMYRYRKDLEGLDSYISELEEWETYKCG